MTTLTLVSAGFLAWRELTNSYCNILPCWDCAGGLNRGNKAFAFCMVCSMIMEYGFCVLVGGAGGCPCFMDSRTEGAALAPCGEKGPAGMWVLLWVRVSRAVHRPWRSLRVVCVRVGETDQQGKYRRGKRMFS